MILYHASNVEVKSSMLVESNRLLDFGPGFYTTTNREQAVRFAKGVVAKRYRFAKGLTGAQVATLFDKYGVSRFIMDSYELLHIESELNMIAAVDEFIERKKLEEVAA